MKEKIFDLATKSTVKDGRYEISCVKGLWGVSAGTREEAEREAKHYFMQYFMDGEYDDHEAYLKGSDNESL